jgi:hypothetical protein
MPVISRFRGIVIRMLFVRQLGARIHAFYGDSELILTLWPLKIIQGDAPTSVRDVVLKWAALHQGELLADWSRCQARQRPFLIAA